MGTTQHFLFDKKNFHYEISIEDEDSDFDKALKDKWTQAEEDNLLRYSVNDQQEKILPGKYGFVVQLNIERATKRRTPAEILTMFQLFDPNCFNFTEVPAREVLLDIGDGTGNDVIIVNVSPIILRHFLLVTERFSCLTQRATEYSFKKAIEIMLLSRSANFRVLFNSLCANASVNHLHWHLYYLNQRMFLETTVLKPLVGSLYTLADYPSKGFCIKFSSFKDHNIDNFVAYAYKVANCLHSHGIAHNIYITRSKTTPLKSEFDDIRIYFWARSSSYGIKNTKDFVIAACENFGHFPIRTQEGFDCINEEHVGRCLKKATAFAFFQAQKLLVQLLKHDNGASAEH